MKFDVFQVPSSCYPRVQHAVKHLNKLSDRFDHLAKAFPLETWAFQTSKTTCNFTEFILCIQITEKGNSLNIKDLLKRSEKCYELGLKEIDEVKDIVIKHAETYCVLVLYESLNEEVISQSDRVKSLIVARNIKQEQTTSERCDVTQNQNDLLKSKISDVMEENIYTAFGMKMKCEQLREVLEMKTNVDLRQEETGCTEPQYKSKTEIITESNYQTRSHELKMKGDLWEKTYLYKAIKKLMSFTKEVRSHRRTKSEGHIILGETVSEGRAQSAYLTESDVRNLTTRLKQFTKAVQANTLNKEDNTVNHEGESISGRNVHVLDYTDAENMERIERLYDEMMGMFSRSHVPQNKQPQIDNQFNGTVSEAMKLDLRQLSPHIKSCGYRCRSFCVFVNDECDRHKLQPDIEIILKNHNCLSPVVISSFSTKQFSSCKVGSKVTAEFEKERDKCGTLGGFAHSHESDKTMCLVSRHVVIDGHGKPATNLKISNDNITATVCIDESTRDRKKNVLDIAAACFEKRDSPFDTNYKSSEEKPVKGRLTHYSREKMKGLPVHMCGSTTPIGFGTITMPKIEGVRDKEMDSYIIIEDMENPQSENTPFCAEGDSGAIVCADDEDNPENVQLISMVIGKTISQEKPGTYHTLDLKDGIQQVEEEIQSKIELL